jgi:hypothetical protein
VANNGRNSANGGSVGVIFPAGVIVSSAPPACFNLVNRFYQCTTTIEEQYEGRALLPGENIGFDFIFEVFPNSTGKQRRIVALAGHAGSETDGRDNLVVVPLITAPSFLGFDDPARPWLRSFSGGVLADTTSSNTTSGAFSGLLACGNTQIDSPEFDTSEIELVGDEFTLDVWVPAAQPNWGNSLTLTVNIPSASIWGQWIGSQNIHQLPRNQWNEVSFTLPQNIQDALLSDFPDARFRITANVADCEAPVLIDSVRLTGNTTVRTIFHGNDPATVVSSSVLTFDDVTRWDVVSGSDGVFAPEDVNFVEGTGALSVAAGHWTGLRSKRFSSQDLMSVTDLLSIEVFIPDLPADFGWVGYLNAFLECPSAGLWNTYLGGQALQILFDDEFNRLEFELSADVMTVLQGDYDDCRFKFDIASNTAFSPFVLDGAGFVQ